MNGEYPIMKNCSSLHFLQISLVNPELEWDASFFEEPVSFSNTSRRDYD